MKCDALTLARQLGYVPLAEAMNMPWTRAVTRKEILELLRTGKAVKEKPESERKQAKLAGMSEDEWSA